MSNLMNHESQLVKRWQDFENALIAFEGDSHFNNLIRQNGFEIKHMIYVNNKITFDIQTSYDLIIPYTILAGGYESCLTFIRNEIEELI